MASVAGSYARAFSDAVMDKHLDAERAVRETRSIAGLIAESREFREVLENPSIAVNGKRSVLDAIAAREGLMREVRNFFAVIIDHQRVALLPKIIELFEKDLSERLGMVDAAITSARELQQPEREMLEGQVAQLTGKKVRPKYEIDPAVLGGAIVRVGSTIYDGSVRGRLENMRHTLETQSS